jgi:uncharacterized membrane protein (UPF0127 family)
MISLKPVQGNTALLITVENPKATLHRSSLHAALDVVFISPEGLITQIMPNLTLSAIKEGIASPKPLRALLLLDAGNAEQLDIRPGDRVQHPLFSPKPTIVQ